ncbi:hypothetical protein SPOG_02162 [Schizosaccharomyces cryophilus OY26]|uniref:Uncharacterized protein n=1 Tax=Schizosaccharomyces cryophilus (strain OY26 / ATCC MYA-4695 / CBS 11777 / NBRC 106824 / NRRL Y48691) TaxID=653667 RepID=S9VZ16_SCHCR|nr:uncharacterized protein SPOG_02162 [Schizosaccharomyces cryophilus OY26]EPY52843.1 hypothetical protein SPOG_02162 [Schizosaccharomyces cryophilus OY26]
MSSIQSSEFSSNKEGQNETLNYLDIENMFTLLNHLQEQYCKSIPEENADDSRYKLIENQYGWCKETSVLISAVFVMILDSIHEFLENQGKVPIGSAKGEGFNHQDTIRLFKELVEESENVKLRHFFSALSCAIEGLQITNYQIQDALEMKDLEDQGDLDGYEIEASNFVERFQNCLKEFTEVGIYVQALGKSKNKRPCLGMYQSFGKSSVEQLQRQLNSYTSRVIEPLLAGTEQDPNSSETPSSSSDGRLGARMKTESKSSFTKLFKKKRFNRSQKELKEQEPVRE